MKLRTLLACASLAFGANAFAAADHDHGHGHGHGHEHEPLHGGVVVEASDMDFEMVPQANAITFHVRDHGKPAKTTGATGKVTVLNGAEKVEAPLTPAGDSQLQAKGDFKVGPGTKVVALVNLPNRKPINVRFAVK